MSSKKPSVTKSPSLVQFFILPVIKLPISGRKTMYLNTTSVCDDPKIIFNELSLYYKLIMLTIIWQYAGIAKFNNFTKTYAETNLM